MRCWVFLLASSASLDRRHRRAKIWPQISPHLWCAQLCTLVCSSFPFLPIHHFRLYSHTLLYRAVHTRRADSFVPKFWGRSTVQNNLQFPICRCPSCCVQSPQYSPATNTLSCRLVRSETSLSRASLLDARLPAVHLQRLGWPLASATIYNLGSSFARFHLQASSTRTLAYTTSHTRLPQSGCSHRARNTSKHTYTTLQSSENPKRQVLTTESSRRYNDIPITATLPSIPLH